MGQWLFQGACNYDAMAQGNDPDEDYVSEVFYEVSQQTACTVNRGISNRAVTVAASVRGEFQHNQIL